jgi:hypothetical protein
MHIRPTAVKRRTIDRTSRGLSEPLRAAREDQRQQARSETDSIKIPLTELTEFPTALKQ